MFVNQSRSVWQHCVTSSAELGSWACQDLFPLPQLSVPCCLSAVKRLCPLGTGSGLWTFCQSSVCPASRPLCPLAWTHSVSAGRTGCLVLRLGVFSPQLLILQFPLYLENQRSWTGSVSASLVCSCWHCCFSHNTVPRECELVCPLQSGSPGLFSNCYCHCEPQGLKLHTICTLRRVLTVPRGGSPPPTR